MVLAPEVLGRAAPKFTLEDLERAAPKFILEDLGRAAPSLKTLTLRTLNPKLCCLATHRPKFTLA